MREEEEETDVRGLNNTLPLRCTTSWRNRDFFLDSKMNSLGWLENSRNGWRSGKRLQNLCRTCKTDDQERLQMIETDEEQLEEASLSPSQPSLHSISLPDTLHTISSQTALTRTCTENLKYFRDKNEMEEHFTKLSEEEVSHLVSAQSRESSRMIAHFW